jgi:hypothetical protein
LSGVDGECQKAFSCVEISNAYQWISTSAFAAAVFRSDRFGDGVSKKLRLSSFRKPSESRLAERIKLDDDGRSECPFLKSERT